MGKNVQFFHSSDLRGIGVWGNKTGQEQLLSIPQGPCKILKGLV